MKRKTVDFAAGKGDITTMLLHKLPVVLGLRVIYQACIVHLQLFQPLASLRAVHSCSGPQEALDLTWWDQHWVRQRRESWSCWWLRPALSFLP